MFYIPSYLKHSRHAEKLEEKHKSRPKTQRDGSTRQSTGTGTLSRSGSGMSLHKMVPSHRGMTYDIQEKFLGFGEEVLAPLPSRWSSHDKAHDLELNADGLEIHFPGFSSPQKPVTGDEAATLRADHPVPRACGVYYFEITVLKIGKDSYVQSNKTSSLIRADIQQPYRHRFQQSESCFEPAARLGTRLLGISRG